MILVFGDGGACVMPRLRHVRGEVLWGIGMHLSSHQAVVDNYLGRLCLFTLVTMVAGNPRHNA